MPHPRAQYLVNLLLASRFLPISPWTSLTLSFLALVIYCACLGINWIWQVAFLVKIFANGPSAVHMAAIAVYLGLIGMVVRDDCVLVKWLVRNVAKTWGAVANKPASNPPSPNKKKVE